MKTKLLSPLSRLVFIFAVDGSTLSLPNHRADAATLPLPPDWRYKDGENARVKSGVGERNAPLLHNILAFPVR